MVRRKLRLDSLQMSEAQMQDALVGALRRAGYVVHFVPDKLYRRSFPRKSQRESGEIAGRWEIDLGDRGYPDLTIVAADGSLYFRECKVGRNQLTDNQIIWRDRLLAGGANWAEWRDDRYDEILRGITDGVVLR